MSKNDTVFGKQFQSNMFFLNHETASDFYLSCWQNNTWTLPLLCFNILLSLFTLSILLTSFIMLGSIEQVGLSYWFIYLTNWGVILITCTTALAFLVSLIAYLRGNSIDATLGLPWYVKAYWTMYNITVPVAMLITILYYGFLKPQFSDENAQSVLNPGLDLLVHGINAVVMVVLLLASRVPTRLLHLWQPCTFMLLYLTFNIIYYYAGGTDAIGNHYIYPGMNWAEPASTSVNVVVAAVGLIGLHVFVWVLSLLRNYCARKCGFYSESLPSSNKDERSEF